MPPMAPMPGPAPLPHPDAVITSHRNPRVKAAAALRDRRAREAAGLTLVDGARELSLALAGGARVAEAFIDEGRLAPEASEMVAKARAAGAVILRVSAAILDQLAYGDRSEGVVATVEIPSLHLSSLRLPPDPLIVVLEGVEKPGNLGAVLRSADGAGAVALIVADPRTDLFNPNAVRASLGTIFTVPLAAGASAEVRAWLAAAGIRVAAAWVEDSARYTDVDLRGPLAIVLGSEADGLSGAWDGDGVTRVSLPMLGVADSLNVSTAAAVLLYEARRQRGVASR
jgi:RNA methyltransferase, TrmH family